MKLAQHTTEELDYALPAVDLNAVKTDSSVSCIVPFFNEGVRLFTILQILSSNTFIDEIICVDDGSTDHMGQLVEHFLPRVHTVRLSSNSGKTSAIRSGMAQAHGDIIFLIDADLSGIHAYEIENALKAMRTNRDIDMIILRRIYAPWFVKFNRSDILLSGERFIRKEHLVKILEEPIKGYELEVAINRYMQQNHKRVHWMPSSAVNIPKMKKNGIWKGLLREIRMFTGIVLYLGIAASVKQIRSFCSKQFTLPKDIKNPPCESQGGYLNN